MRCNVLRNNIKRHIWSVIRAEPVTIVSFYIGGKFGIAITFFQEMGLTQAIIIDTIYLDFPLGHFFIDISPFIPIRSVKKTLIELCNKTCVLFSDLISAYFISLKYLFNCHNNLIRINRFDKVISDLRGNCLIHQPFFFTFCDHNNRNRRIDTFDFL